MFEIDQKLWIIQNPHYNIIPSVFISQIDDDTIKIATIKGSYNNENIIYKEVKINQVFTSVTKAKNYILNSIYFDIDDMKKKLSKKEKQLIKVSNKFLDDDDYESFIKIRKFLKNERNQRQEEKSI